MITRVRGMSDVRIKGPDQWFYMFKSNNCCLHTASITDSYFPKHADIF